jgi:hypothetical protein
LLTDAPFKLFAIFTSLSLHFQDVVAEFGEDKVSVFKDFLPSRNGLTQVGKTFAPDIHGASVVAHSLHLVNVDHVSAALIRLHNLLEQNQVFVLDAVHVAW